MRIAPYSPSDAPRWDAFVSDCPMATFLQTRRFLSYHGDRFDDRSLLFVEGDALLGVLPAAVAGQSVESHPGATYGGIVHNGGLAGGKMREAVGLIEDHYRQSGFSSFVYRSPPPCYRRQPCDDDIYALHSAGAVLSTCGLSCVINLKNRGDISKARKKGAKKASRAGLTTVCDLDYLPAIWRLVEDSLWSRYQKKPVHSFDEISHLAELFPDHIKFYAGLLEGEVVCGGVFFLTPSVWHAQYVHSSDIGREIYALDLFYEDIIPQATASDALYFSFGISDTTDLSTHEKKLNEGLYSSKKQFGGGGEANFTFTLPLRPAAGSNRAL